MPTKVKRKSFITNATIIAAVIGVLGIITGQIIQGYTSLKLEKTRFESELILDALKDQNIEDANKRLRFLLRLGMVEEYANKLNELLGDSTFSLSQTGFSSNPFNIGIISNWPDNQLIKLKNSLSCRGSRSVLFHHLETSNFLLDFDIHAFELFSQSRLFPTNSLLVAFSYEGVGTDEWILLQAANGPDFLVNNESLLSYVRDEYEIDFIGKGLFDIENECVIEVIQNSDQKESLFDPYVLPQHSNRILQNGKLNGKIMSVDNWGNVNTNFSSRIAKQLIVDDILTIEFDKREIKIPVRKTYMEVSAENDVAIFVNGYLQIATNRESFARKYDLKQGTILALKKQ